MIRNTYDIEDEVLRWVNATGYPPGKAPDEVEDYYCLNCHERNPDLIYRDIKTGEILGCSSCVEALDPFELDPDDEVDDEI